MGKRVLLLLLAGVAAGCSSSELDVSTYGAGAGALAVGEVCIPTDEASPEFAGYATGEVNIATLDPQCASSVCLTYHFQGRVTCAEGNAGPAECYTPAGEQVTASVPPQAPDTPPEEHVYCSCRCHGPTELGPFCECPSGMKCELLVPYYGGEEPEDPLYSSSGAYCVKQ
jgi:hypothetical protein